MLDLTAAQHSAWESGEPVPCVIGATECVIVRKDVLHASSTLHTTIVSGPLKR